MRTILLTAIGLGLLLLTCMLPAQALLYSGDTELGNVDGSFHGPVDSRLAGCIDIAGDVNGDGYDDMIIGTADGNKAYLFLGNASGGTMDLSTSYADHTFNGEGGLGKLGSRVAGAGDVNGDGYDDILLGAYSINSGYTDNGKVYVVFGGTWLGGGATTSMSNANASYLGERNYAYAGLGLDSAGDVNGDGFDDFLIGAPRDSEGGAEYYGQAYLILGKATGWIKNKGLGQADASFIGKETWNYVGGDVAGLGDIDGDGLDDFAISGDGGGGNDEGEVYIFFGNHSGWKRNTAVTDANVTYIGEASNDEASMSTAGGGDLNGDGLADVIVGAKYGGNSNYGAAYILFGRKSGWPTAVTSLANANASIEGNGGKFGMWLDCGGDVNGDGYDDFIVAARDYNPGGKSNAGRSYLYLGKASGWAMDTSYNTAAATFTGEVAWDYSGTTVCMTGDVNGDGYADMMVGSSSNEEGGTDSGQAYLIYPDHNSQPSTVTSVKAYHNAGYTKPCRGIMMNNTLYFELRGTDGNSSRKDIATVRIISSGTDPIGYIYPLYETGLNTGVYRGKVEVRDRSREFIPWIGASLHELINVSSFVDPSRDCSVVVVDTFELKPDTNIESAMEDILYSSAYTSIGENIASLDMHTNASWLSANQSTMTLEGTPVNNEVGSYFAHINATDGYYRYFERNFTITVANANPSILTSDQTSVDEDSFYQVDYDTDDDGQGTITWEINTTAYWLNFNSTTGEINGTPTNDEVGSFDVNITVHDGNGGWDRTVFTLNVVNTNDNPHIDTHPGDVVMDEDTTAYLNITDWFDDIDGDVLTYRSEGEDKVTVVIHSNGTAQFDPEADWSGFENITFVGDDGPLEIKDNLTVTVNPVNDAPHIIANPGTQVFNEDSSHNISLVDWFGDIDTELLVFKVEGDNKLTVNIQLKNATLIPDADWNGSEELTFFASDGEFEISDTINITVLATNDAPYDAAISIPITEVDEGTEVPVQGSAYDLDLPFDELAFTWTSNITGVIGIGKNIVLNLTAGVHEVLLNVTDLAGAYDTESVLFTVNAIPDPVDPNGIDGGDGDPNGTDGGDGGDGNGTDGGDGGDGNGTDGGDGRSDVGSGNGTDGGDGGSTDGGSGDGGSTDGGSGNTTDGGSTDGGSGNTTDGGDGGGSTSMDNTALVLGLVAVIALLVLVVIGMAIFMVMRGKKSEPVQEEEPEEEEPPEEVVLEAEVSGTDPFKEKAETEAVKKAMQARPVVSAPVQPEVETPEVEEPEVETPMEEPEADMPEDFADPMAAHVSEREMLPEGIEEEDEWGGEVE